VFSSFYFFFLSFWQGRNMVTETGARTVVPGLTDLTSQTLPPTIAFLPTLVCPPRMVASGYIVTLSSMVG
jgi:hypothetical protein